MSTEIDRTSHSYLLGRHEYLLKIALEEIARLQKEVEFWRVRADPLMEKTDNGEDR